MKTSAETTYYGLTTAQKVAYMQYKYCFFKEAINVVICLYVKQQLDPELLKKALNIEIERNDCLRLFFRKKKDAVSQFISDPYIIDKIPEADFTNKSKTEQNAFLSKDAKKPLRVFKDEIFRIKLIKTYDGRNGIYFAVSHLNMDAMAVFMFFNDLLRVYTALSEHSEMPKPFLSFVDHIEKDKQNNENTERIARAEAYFRELYETGGEPMYCPINGAGPLEDYRKKRKNPNLRSFPISHPLQDKTNNLKLHFSPELSDRIDSYCAEKNTTPLALIKLAMHIYISKVNNGAEDTMGMVICNNRATLAEKNTSGTFADAVPVRMIIAVDKKIDEALDITGDILSKSFRHSSYGSIRTVMLSRKFYKRGIFDTYDSTMFTYLIISPVEKWDIDAEWISNGRFAISFYIILVRNLSQYEVYYEYRTKVLKREDIEACHGGIEQIIKLGMENPQLSIGEIIEKLI